MALVNGDPRSALAHWDGETERARREGDPIRTVQAISALAVAQGLLGNSDAALPPTQEAVEIADATGNPTARSMAYFSLGYLLKKSDPERALFLFDEAARLAGEVRNRWWFGIALLEGAGTRAMHGDPAPAARMLIETLDHWDRVGDWVEQWVGLRYATRFFARVGAADDAVFLHCAIANAGKPPPLRAAQLDGLVNSLGANPLETYSASPAGGAEAVVRARSSLQRYADYAAVPAVPPSTSYEASQ
ncbi:hypothetical protein MSIMFI_04601 [Mycobacterium simulans]|nr:hypothetical protein MSIMFI_04601 [Mycobacterium simulans]